MPAYIPKKLTHDELKEFLAPEAMVLMLTYFEHNPMKTTFKISDKKHRVTVRRFDYGDHFKYTLSLA